MELKNLALFSGSWICKSENFETEEFWQKPKSDLMLGLNRTVSKSGNTAFEFLRIFQQENEIFYAASPNGKPATLFKLTEVSDNKVVFENPEHDFPQRIIYTFQNENKMAARIDGEIDGISKHKEWIFTKEKIL
jgi:Domain of unknown function (DUF6265)